MSTDKCPGFISAVGEEQCLVVGPAQLARTRHEQEGPGPWALPFVSFFGLVFLGSFITTVFPRQCGVNKPSTFLGGAGETETGLEGGEKA